MVKVKVLIGGGGGGTARFKFVTLKPGQTVRSTGKPSATVTQSTKVRAVKPTLSRSGAKTPVKRQRQSTVSQLGLDNKSLTVSKSITGGTISKVLKRKKSVLQPVSNRRLFIKSFSKPGSPLKTQKQLERQFVGKRIVDVVSRSPVAIARGDPPTDPFKSGKILRAVDVGGGLMRDVTLTSKQGIITSLVPARKAGTPQSQRFKQRRFREASDIFVRQQVALRKKKVEKAKKKKARATKDKIKGRIFATFARPQAFGIRGLV